VANCIQATGAVDRILTFDTHSDQIQGFYDIPVDNLYGALIHSEHFKQVYADRSNLVVLATDQGGVVRSRRFATMIDETIPVYSIDKRRTGPNKTEVMNFIGDDIAGKDVIVYDDMIDTGGSIIAAAEMAKKRGARQVYLCATHGLFSTKPGEKMTEERFRNAGMEVIVTDSIPRSTEYMQQNSDWLTIKSIEPLLSKAIEESAAYGGSISSLFSRTT
jgi:ribose-phosphate pyrophosphokinase